MFIAYVEQKSEGCDYSIACGIDMFELKAQTTEDALKELYNKVIGKYDDEEDGYVDGYWDKTKLKRAVLLNVSEKIEAPINDWYEDVVWFDEQKKEELSKASRRKEYERMKKEFGD